MSELPGSMKSPSGFLGSGVPAPKSCMSILPATCPSTPKPPCTKTPQYVTPHPHLCCPSLQPAASSQGGIPELIAQKPVAIYILLGMLSGRPQHENASFDRGKKKEPELDPGWNYMQSRVFRHTCIERISLSRALARSLELAP